MCKQTFEPDSERYILSIGQHRSKLMPGCQSKHRGDEAAPGPRIGHRAHGHRHGRGLGMEWDLGEDLPERSPEERLKERLAIRGVLPPPPS